MRAASSAFRCSVRASDYDPLANGCGLEAVHPHRAGLSSSRPRERSMRTVTCSDPVMSFHCAGTQVHALRRIQGTTLTLRDLLGFERNVVVQATCHGADNSAVVDALTSARGRARGIATVKRDVTDTGLQALDRAGVRGVRFNFVKRLVDTTPREVLLKSRRGSSRSAGTSSPTSKRRNCRSCTTFLQTADRRRRRSHGPSRCDQARRRTGV